LTGGRWKWWRSARALRARRSGAEAIRVVFESGFDGAGRIGGHSRVALLQEHCLLYLHGQLTNRTSKRRFPYHQYFLNYLRQQALCHPDLTLEPGDFATRDFEVDRVGQTHTRRDFETAWDYNARTWLDSIGITS
jgi:hypothetical protein